MKEKTVNPFVEELKKFVKQDCVVTDINGYEYEGQCRAISFMHLNVVLMTKTEKIVIKNISAIRRKRTTPEKAKK